MHHFLDNLNCPTGFQFYKDGVLVMQAPDLWFVRDTDGDGKADWKERVLMGLDSADSHHTTNSMATNRAARCIFRDGVFHRTQVETARGPVRNNDAAIYRFEPRTGKFETLRLVRLRQPARARVRLLGQRHHHRRHRQRELLRPGVHRPARLPEQAPEDEAVLEAPVAPVPRHGHSHQPAFPRRVQRQFPELQRHPLQGIFRVKITEEGSGLKGETLEHLVISDDPKFRPAAVNVGPDGSLYFADWSNAIIGHMQHHLRDPNRDHVHGRIYRITSEGRPLLKPAKIDGEPIEKLLELLKEPENDVRTRAKIELGTRDSAKVTAAAQKWAAALDKNDPAYEHHLIEALWVHQWHNVVNLDLLRTVLGSPEPRARAAAARVFCYWRDRVPDALALFKKLAADENPRVRLEAVRAASFYSGEEVKPALDVVFEAVKRETDYYLEYCALETLRQLQPGRNKVLPEDPKSLSWIISRMDNAQLLQAPDLEPVLLARIERKGLDLGARDKALSELGHHRKTSKALEAIAALHRLDALGADAASPAAEIGKILTISNPAELTKERARLAELAGKATQPAVRRAAWAAIVTADGKPATAWEAAAGPAREALIDAIRFIVDPGLRAQFQPLLAATLTDAQASAGLRAAALRALPFMGAQHAAVNFATLATSLREGKDRATAARGIMQLPRESWAKPDAGPIVDAIIAWAQTVPAGQRTQQDFVETIQAGMEISTLLPEPYGPSVRKQLRGLSVAVFVVKTVHEQMRYDTARLVVEPGKPFEVIFENVDQMPHNIVFVKPGTREQVGTQANTMSPTNLDKEGRSYVPQKNDNIFAASKLLEPGQKQTLKIKAPSQPGEYEYVCTFPGHWPVMWGKLIVTKDPEAALKAAAGEPAPAVASAHKH